jgi:hypothetical protein
MPKWGDVSACRPARGDDSGKDPYHPILFSRIRVIRGLFFLFRLERHRALIMIGKEAPTTPPLHHSNAARRQALPAPTRFPYHDSPRLHRR